MGGVSDSLPDQAAEVTRTPFAAEVVTHLSQDHIDRLTRVFAEIGVSGWLERHPLRRLELMPEVLSDAIPVNGLYKFTEQVMQVATFRNKGDFGKPFVWQSIFSVSSVGESPLEANRRTLVHELGHHIHGRLFEADVEGWRQTVGALLLRGGSVISRRNAFEYFAETFALLVYHRAALENHDPEGYGMIQKALGVLHLEVKTP